jgi:hypothetical protein
LQGFCRKASLKMSVINHLEIRLSRLYGVSLQSERR